MKINEFIPNQTIEMLNKATSKTNADQKEDSKQFTSILKEELNNVNDKQVENQQMVQQYINGGDVDMHDLMISSQEAKLSLQLAVEVRNKLVDAYNELNRMQL